MRRSCLHRLAPPPICRTTDRNRHRPRTRRLLLEPLEERALLSNPPIQLTGMIREFVPFDDSHPQGNPDFESVDYDQTKTRAPQLRRRDGSCPD